MTTHFVDITLLSDPEFSEQQLMAALVSKLHRGLVALSAADIGVSFPRHIANPANQRGLGSVMRLHGDDVRLNALLRSDWLRGMRDHTRVEEALLAPQGAVHRVVQRRQFKTNVERLRRRRMRRKGEGLAEVRLAIPDFVQQKPNLPYVMLRSSSTAQPFSLFIDHGALLAEPMHGGFNTYGLSVGGSVPWF